MNLAVIFFLFHVSIYAQKDHSDADSLSKITISAVGDLMCHSTQYKWAKVSADSFDFKPVFRIVKPYLEKADFTIGNLETVIAGPSKEYSGYPVFNTPKHFLEGLKDAGFDILVTANNHITDGRKDGIINTISEINNYDMMNVGTFVNRQESDSAIVLMKNNIRFSLLAYTYALNINNLKREDSYMVNLIDTVKIKSDIENARQNNADFVIVYLHIGNENKREPDSYHRQTVRKVVEYGADVVLCASTHTLQPIEIIHRENKNDSALVFYSLGNFISNQRWRFSDGGVIVNFSFYKNNRNGSTHIDNVGFLPIWVFKGINGNKYEYVILPSHESEIYSYPFLTGTDLKNMKQSYEDTYDILLRYGFTPKLMSTN